MVEVMLPLHDYSNSHRFSLIDMEVSSAQFLDWVRDNDIIDWFYGDNTGTIIYFYNDEDAVAFKLAWS